MEQLNVIVEKLAEPKFYTIEEVAELTGWCLSTVRDLFNRDDFPSTNFGKEKKVEREALKEYFKVPRRKWGTKEWI